MLYFWWTEEIKAKMRPLVFTISSCLKCHTALSKAMPDGTWAALGLYFSAEDWEVD